MDTEAAARKVAAKVAGIREDQVDTVVIAYRQALDALYDEPEWRSVMFLPDVCVARAEGTTIQLELCTTAPSRRYYVYRNQVYGTFGEARAVELAAEAKFSVRDV